MFLLLHRWKRIHRLLFVTIVFAASLILISTVPAAAYAASPRPLILGNEGETRQLPDHLFGGSVEALIEHLLDDPTKIAALKQNAPAVIRFPGGSQSNYYDWKSGLLNITAQANSSSYMKFWAAVAPKIDSAFPKGIKMEQYAPAAQQIGADVILVPNLETATVDDQVAWFKQLASENMLPTNIELGNEFWIAMAGDPNVMKKWPDEPRSLAVMQQYAAALRPIVGSKAKFAVQAAAAAFNYLPTATGAFPRRLFAWDAALSPAPWFDAVTAHLYPRPEELAASIPNATTQQLFDLYMGQGDSGVDRALNDITKQLPGKEIWITEWSPRGGNPGDVNNPNYRELVPPPMRAQLIARYELAFLRHPTVTKALYFMLNFDDKSVFQEFIRNADGTGYVPMAPAMVLNWFNDAANAGATFQRVIESSAQPIANIGAFQDAYRAIEGGLFKSDKQTVLILQNASGEARLYDPVKNGKTSVPTEADLIVTTNLTAQGKVAGAVTALPTDQSFTLPPYSILRLVWKS